MRYIRENADKYGIDAKHVCAVGFSAFPGQIHGGRKAMEILFCRNCRRQLREEDRIYVNKFTSSYSDFALQNMTNMREILDAEYVKIIMGADIDNFDKAVETWYSTGGDRITEEVNEWYQSTK